MPSVGRAKAGKTSNGRWASEDDFDKYRQVITELFHQNNMTVPGIMDVMETRHGFSATAKMYKTRFRRWGLWKHNPCPAHEPPAVIVPTQTPTHLPGEEAAYRALRDYYDGSFVMRRWQSENDSLGPHSRLSREDQVLKAGVETYVRFRAALGLLERPSRGNNGGKAGDFAQGVRLMRISFAELPGILAQGESPMLPIWMMYITTMFRESSARDFQPVETQLLRHLYGLTNLPNGKHPSARLWHALCTGGQEVATRRHHLRVYAAIALEQFSKHLGALHPWTVDLSGLAIGLLHPNGQGNPDDKTTRFRELFRNLETFHPRYDIRHINTLCCWASHYRYHGSRQGRADLLEDGISMLEGVLSDPTKAAFIDEYHQGAFDMYSLCSSMSYRLGRWDVAEARMRHALTLAKRQWEETGEDSDLFEGLNGLEMILRAKGDIPAADGVQSERRMLVRKTLEMVGEKEDSVGTDD
ncbi:hypothetical protein OQA88_2059 [Cercophora sp. LCS_1]